MASHHGKSSTDPPSPSSMYLTFNANPTTPVYETAPMTLTNGKTTRGRACEICGRVTAVGSRGSLHAFNTHKSACERKRGSLVISHLTNPGDRARSLSAAPSSAMFLSLMIPSHSLTPSLPASPSNSPTFSPAYSLFDVAFSSQDRGALTDSEPPRISVNPTSDDLVSPSVCTGMTVRWRPGTIWETYQFPSHSFVRHSIPQPRFVTIHPNRTRGSSRRKFSRNPSHSCGPSLNANIPIKHTKCLMTFCRGPLASYRTGQVIVRYQLRCDFLISSLLQARSISSSTTSFQYSEPEFFNEIPRSPVSFAVKSTFLEICECMLAGTFSTTCAAKLMAKEIKRYVRLYTMRKLLI